MSLANLISKTKVALANITEFDGSNRDTATKLTKTYMEDNVHQYLVDITSSLQSERRNVIDYGAVGDGVNDDAIAIQAAIDSLSNGGIVVFPQGTYLINTTIDLTGKRDIILEGHGGTTTNVSNIKTGSAIDAIKMGSSINNTRGCVIRKLRIEGNAVGVNGIVLEGSPTGPLPSIQNEFNSLTIANFTGSAIKLVDWAFSNDFWRLDISGCKYGIEMLSRANDIGIIECEFDAMTSWALRIIPTTDEASVRVISSTFQGNSGGIICGGVGVFLRVLGSYFEANIGISIDSGTNSQIAIVGSNFIGNAAAAGSTIAIRCQDNAYIVGNSITGGATNQYTTAGIQLVSGANNCYIAGNRISVAGGATKIDNQGSDINYIHDFDANSLNVGINTIFVTGAAGTLRGVNFQTAGVLRWVFRHNSNAETGSNVGSDFLIISRADDGSAAANVLHLERATGNVSLNRDSPGDPVALLQMDSTTKGFLPPRMTTTQRDAITSPPAGLIVFNSTTNTINVFDGSNWRAISLV